MKRFIAVSLLALVLLPAHLSAQEPIDRDMVERIRQEGYENSRVMEVFGHLTNVIGPRLTASPAYQEAVRWTRDKMGEWGMKNVRAEGWEFGRGWELEGFSVEMIEPRYMPMIGYPRGWSPATDGKLVGEPVFMGDIGAADALRDFEGRLSGRIVLTRPTQTRFVREDRPQPSLEDALVPPSGRSPTSGTLSARATAEREERQLRQELRRTITETLESEKAGVTLEPNVGEHGTLFVTGRDGGPDSIPSVVLAAEHYNLIVRLIEQGIPVQLAVNVESRYYTDDTNAYHVIAEIPGTDPEIGDEVVMVGAHLDSWHSATGATDNADGCSIAMEALRILTALGVEPRRTIRIALWGGEEQGLLGSREYVEQHLAGEENKTAHDKFSVYFNLDNGYAPIYGFFMEGNQEAREIMEAYLEPFNDLGARVATLQGVGSTDHLSFIRAGLPGFQAIHDYTDYDVRTHHTNVDTFERVGSEDLKQAAVVMASVLYHAAMREGRMPRAPALGQ